MAGNQRWLKNVKDGRIIGYTSGGAENDDYVECDKDGNPELVGPGGQPMSKALYFEGMTKVNLVKYAKDNFDADLNKASTKEVLVKQIEELAEKGKISTESIAELSPIETDLDGMSKKELVSFGRTRLGLDLDSNTDDEDLKTMIRKAIASG
jgi:undecaprenyl pyrophosphate synthase